MGSTEAFILFNKQGLIPPNILSFFEKKFIHSVSWNEWMFDINFKPKLISIDLNLI
jgi:hypothetical protein